MRREQQAPYLGNQMRQQALNTEKNLVPQEQARLVLGAQPPAPGTMPFRYVDYENPESRLEFVQSQPYYTEEEYPPVEPLIDITQESYVDPKIYVRDMGETSPMLLLGNPPRNRGYPGPNPIQKTYPVQQQGQPTVLGPCFECSGPHLVRDCPHWKRPQNTNGGILATPAPRMQFPPVERYCIGCCVDHLPKDYLIKPADLATPKGNVSLNIVSVIPSPTTSETEGEMIPVRVVTRAQKNALRRQDEAKTPLRKPRRKTRSRRGKKVKENPVAENPIPKELEGILRPCKTGNTAGPGEKTPEHQQEQTSSSETDSGGSVLVEKVNEPLDAALKAVECRITPFTELPKKLQEYPNSRAEKIGLAVHQQLIRETQAMLEGPPPAYKRQPASIKPRLDTIVEATSNAEKGSEIVSLPPFDDAPLDDKPESNKPNEGYTTADFGDEIPEFEETLAKEMWDAMHQQVDEQGSSIHSPLVDFTSKRTDLDDNHSLNDGSQTEAFESSDSKQ